MSFGCCFIVLGFCEIYGFVKVAAFAPSVDGKRLGARAVRKISLPLRAHGELAERLEQKGRTGSRSVLTLPPGGGRSGSANTLLLRFSGFFSGVCTSCTFSVSLLTASDFHLRRKKMNVGTFFLLRSDS